MHLPLECCYIFIALKKYNQLQWINKCFSQNYLQKADRMLNEYFGPVNLNDKLIFHEWSLFSWKYQLANKRHAKMVLINISSDIFSTMFTEIQLFVTHTVKWDVPNSTSLQECTLLKRRNAVFFLNVKTEDIELKQFWVKTECYTIKL